MGFNVLHYSVRVRVNSGRVRTGNVRRLEKVATNLFVFVFSVLDTAYRNTQCILIDIFDQIHLPLRRTDPGLTLSSQSVFSPSDEASMPYLALV